MYKISKIAFFVILLLVVCLPVSAQWGPGYEAITITVSPDKQDWTYKTGEEVNFTISVWHYDNELLVAPNAGHHDFPEQKVITNAWLHSKPQGEK